MSCYAFSDPHPLGAAPAPNAEIIKKMLLENEELIKTIYDFQKKGRVAECFPLQKVLHRNLVYLATLADANGKMDSPMSSEFGGGRTAADSIAASSTAALVTVTATTSTAMSTTTGPDSSAHVVTPSISSSVTTGT